VDEQKVKKNILNSSGKDGKAVVRNISFISACLLSLIINILLCSPNISLQFKQGIGNGV